MNFSVRMLLLRKRVGIKAIETDHIDTAEAFIRELLGDGYFPFYNHRYVVQEVSLAVDEANRKVLLYILINRESKRLEKFRVYIELEN
ncbi:MAG: hypothetical protein JWO58_2006 [Chitinophagaceae bacterium]|nr:hypothetical protein [Chitinophagaceae bacterium]